MEKVQTQPIYPRGLDLEQVWTELMETEWIANENSLQIKEMDWKIKKITQQNKTDRKLILIFCYEITTKICWSK
jgi:hypothetical protein